MGRREQTENYFGKRVKTERELRKWSQAQMAKLLSDNDIPMIHPSTIAKIELGSRPTRIDEATAIADLFGISLDALLGREGMEDESSHAMTVLADEATRLAPEVARIRDGLRRAYRDMEVHFNLADFTARVSEGARWNFSGLSLEQKRALLMWLHKEIAVMNAGDLLDHLTTVARIRGMSAVEIGRQVKVEEMKAALVQRRLAEEVAEYDTTEA